MATYLLSATITSILLSSVFFTYLFELHLTGYSYENPSDILKLVGSLAWVLLGLSTLEFICTFGLKSYATTYSKTKLSIAKLLSGSYLMKNIRLIKQNPLTWYSILGTSVFWSISQNLLVVFQAHAKINLNIDSVFLVQLILSLAIIGIILGSFISGRRAQKSIKFKNIWRGAILIIICSISIPLFSAIEFAKDFLLGPVFIGEPLSLALLLIAVAIFLFGLGAGIMIVPLNALIQVSAAPDNLGTIIAGKNWMQDIAMILLLCITSIFSYFAVGSEYILYLNALIAIVGFTIVLKKLKSIYQVNC